MFKNNLLKVMALALLLIVGMSLVPHPATVAAQDASLPFAEYFPADTVLYAYLRTDDAYIDQLDSIILRLTANLPAEAGIPPGLGLRAGLNLVSASLGGDFNTVFRGWLGDGAAIAIPAASIQTPSEEDNFILAVQITDRAALQSFVASIFTRNGGAFTPTEVGGFTVLDLDANAALAIGDDVAFLAPNRDLLPLEITADNSLAGSTAFSEAMSQLPAENYNILLYVDTPVFQQMNVMDADASPLGDTPVGTTAIGATILNDTTLTLDIVQGLGALTDIQGVSLPAMGAVDPAFLAYVPTDATLVLQGTNLRALYESFIASIPTLTAQDFDPTTAEEIQQGLAMLDEQFMAAAGVTFQDGLMSWLTGDFAFYATYTVPEPGTPSFFTSSLYPDFVPADIGIDAGWIIEATDPAKAAALVDGVGNALTNLGAGVGTTVTRETINGTNAVVVTTPAVDTTPAVSVIIAANDRFLIIGTRKGATAALEGSGGFNTSSRFIASSEGVVLSGATTVWYADANVLNLLGDALYGTGPAIQGVFNNIISGLDPNATPVPFDYAAAQAEAARAQQQFRQFAALFAGATISTASSENGSILIRATLTLAQ